MKIKSFIAIIIASFLVINIKAQTNDCPYVLKISPNLELKAIKGSLSHLRSVIKYNNGDVLGVFFVRGYNIFPDYITFKQFNSNLEIIKSNIIENNVDDFNFFEFKNKKYCLLHKDNLTKILDFNSIKLDFNDAPVKTLPSKKGELDYKLNMDSTKALAIYSESSNTDLKNAEAGFVVIDDNFNVLFEKECNLIGYRHRKEKKIMNDDSRYIKESPYFQGILTNDGKVVLLYECYYDDSKELIKNGKTNFYYRTLIFDKNTSEPIVSNIYLENYFVDYREEPKLILSSNNKITISFMCNKDAEITRKEGFKGNGVSALCHIEIDTHVGKDYNIKDNIVEIPNEILKQYTTPNSKQYLTGYITLKLAVPMPDGGLKFICEEQIESEHGSIYVISFRPDNKYEWTKKIPRRIAPLSVFNGVVNSSNGVYGSFLIDHNGFNFLIYKGNLNLVYLGTKLNFNLPLNQAPKISKKEKQPLISIIDTNGNINTSLLMDTKNLKYDFLSPNPEDFKIEDNCLYGLFEDLKGRGIGFSKTPQHLYSILPR